jgi:hypothetical protein
VAVEPGARCGAYEILALLDAGGLGGVYHVVVDRAREGADTIQVITGGKLQPLIEERRALVRRIPIASLISKPGNDRFTRSGCADEAP